MVVQLVLSVEVWIWNAVAYAVSQSRPTWQMLWEEPRSTSSHCGSENALDQRVPVLPSVAAAAGVPAFSVDDAVVVLFSATLVVPQVPVPPPLALIVQVNVDEPVTPVPSRAETVTLLVPAAV